MGAIRLRQIDKALGYDRNVNTMALNLENKQVAQKIREMPRDPCAMIDAQKMMDVNDAANALKLMLDGTYAHLSVLTHAGVRIEGEQFGNAARDAWDVEPVVSTYNEISEPFMSANGPRVKMSFAPAISPHVWRKKGHALLQLVRISSVKGSCTPTLTPNVRSDTDMEKWRMYTYNDSPTQRRSSIES